jgi:hypothetical protein
VLSLEGRQQFSGAGEAVFLSGIDDLPVSIKSCLKQNEQVVVQV